MEREKKKYNCLKINRIKITVKKILKKLKIFNCDFFISRIFLC